MMKKKISVAFVAAFLFAVSAFAQTDFWEPVKGVLTGPVSALAIDRNEVIFSGTSNGVGRSIDNGDSWKVDLPGISVIALALNNAGHVFAGTAGNGVYRSIDNGATWNPVNNGLNNHFIFALTHNDAQHLFAGTFDGGVFRSIDNGDSWQAVNNGLTETSITALASNSAGHLFAGTNAGAFRSLNNGASWSPINAGLPARYVFALALNAANQLFAGTGNDGVFRSTNNGDSWEGLNLDLGAVVDVRALALNADGHLYAAALGPNFGGVFRSLNNGDTWEDVNAGLPRPRILALNFDRQSRILAGTDGDGVFRSIAKTTSVAENAVAMPPAFTLAQNYPNPFNPSTTIVFDLAQSASVKLKVFDVAGREVAVLVHQNLQAGSHQVVFAPKDLSNGVYFYRLEADGFTHTKRLTLLK